MLSLKPVGSNQYREGRELAGAPEKCCSISVLFSPQVAAFTVLLCLENVLCNMSRRHLSQMCPRNTSNAAFDDSGALTLIKCVLLFKMMLCGWLVWWRWWVNSSDGESFKILKVPGVCAREAPVRWDKRLGETKKSCIYLRETMCNRDWWQVAATSGRRGPQSQGCRTWSELKQLKEECNFVCKCFLLSCHVQKQKYICFCYLHDFNQEFS